MHLIKPIRSCIEHAIQVCGPGLKAMIIDDNSVAIVSAGFSKSQFLLREVYLVENIKSVYKSDEQHNHLKCVVIVRPTDENIDHLSQELSKPHYRSYYIFFTNKVKIDHLRLLATVDENEVVRCIHELPLDYQATTPFLFSLRIKNTTYSTLCDEGEWNQNGLMKTTQGLMSTLFALRVNPSVRFQVRSNLCRNLARRIWNSFRRESTINSTLREAIPFDNQDLLLILDRRFDAITPFINSWNYYSMIHNEFNIDNNRICLDQVPDRKPSDPKEMLLSLDSDRFFSENYFRSYGDVVPILKKSLENLKSLAVSQKKLDTIEDMKRVVNDYPEAKRNANNIQNHLFLMTEMSRIVNDHQLLMISELEHELINSFTSSMILTSKELLKKIVHLISLDKVKRLDAIRLACLYHLSKPNAGTPSTLISTLKNRNDITDEDLNFIRKINMFPLAKNTKNSEFQNVARKVVQNVKGMDNVNLQYQPQLVRIVDDMKKVKLKEADFPFEGERNLSNNPPRKVIIFMIGGVTYDEALVIDRFNQSSENTSRIKAIIGGSTIHNVNSFIDEIKSAFKI